MQFAVSTQKVIRMLLLVMGLLIVLHFASYIPVLRGVREAPVNLLNMDGEQNVTALFSTFLLWFCSALTWFIARVVADRASRQKWLGLSIIYLYLGFDESISLHERLSGLVNSALPTVHMASFAWVLPYAVALLFLLFIYVKLWWKLPNPVRIRAAIGGGLFVAGGMGFEFIGWLVTRVEASIVFYHIEIFLEEILEMGGTICLVSAFLNYIGMLSPSAVITITTEPARELNSGS